MEFFDVYNKQGKKLNKQVPRGTKLGPGEFYKVVHLWIQNHQGQYLIQQRNKETDTFPYQWAPTAGAVQVGEDPIQSVVREAKEELGLVIDSKDLIHVQTWIRENLMGNVILDVYYIKKDIDLNTLSIDPIEVKDITYASIQDIQVMTENNQFWNYRLIDKNYYERLERIKL